MKTALGFEPPTSSFKLKRLTNWAIDQLSFIEWFEIINVNWDKKDLKIQFDNVSCRRLLISFTWILFTLDAYHKSYRSNFRTLHALGIEPPTSHTLPHIYTTGLYRLLEYTKLIQMYCTALSKHGYNHSIYWIDKIQYCILMRLAPPSGQKQLNVWKKNKFLFPMPGLEHRTFWPRTPCPYHYAMKQMSNSSYIQNM